MKNIKIFFVLFAILIISCDNLSRKPDSLETLICEKLKTENIGNSLIFYISEGMCSSCIDAEIQNLKNNDKMMDQLVVVGFFSSKRHFRACANSISHLKPIKKIFINILETDSSILKESPFYFLYHQESNSYSNYFQPQPCNSDLTAEYFELIEAIL